MASRSGHVSLIGGSTALCWLVLEVLTWAVAPFEGGWRDWVLYDTGIFIVWCVRFAMAGELMNGAQAAEIMMRLPSRRADENLEG